MRGKRPDWQAKTVVKVDGGEDRWREIGVAFESENGESITVLLDALPVSGKIILTRPKERSGKGD